MAVKRSHSLSIGIVGLPNAGKSTLFNSLTENSVPAENFPFCTIDKNVGVIEVPDERLDRMAEMFDSEKTVPSAITFVDIAGLVKGASKGEGLGNKFLSHIREVDAVMYVLRCFSNKSISHVYERVDPYDDYKIVQTELILRDLETVENKISDVEKKARIGTDKESVFQHGLLERLREHLGQEKPAVEFERDEKEKEYIRDLWLLSDKPRFFVLNIEEGMDEELRKEAVEKFKDSIQKEEEDFVVEVDVKEVGKMSSMDEEEKKEYETLLGYQPTSAKDIIQLGFERLNLITFYTGSEKEANAWSIEKGATAKEAAGVIHTDLSENFVAADVVSIEELLEQGSLVECRNQGLVKSKSKDYVVQDGDYILIQATKS
jgi:hypothetical protein